MSDEYTKYCISEEGKEYLRKMCEEKNSPQEEKDFELNMDEEIDFENLKIFDVDDEDVEDSDTIDEEFKINEERNDDDYDFHKETLN